MPDPTQIPNLLVQGQNGIGSMCEVCLYLCVYSALLQDLSTKLFALLIEIDPKCSTAHAGIEIDWLGKSHGSFGTKSN